MSNNNNDLFALIHALTPKEKRLVENHVFVYTKGGSSALLKLYKAICRQKEFNDEPLRKLIPNLSVRKNELWNKIMLVLQSNEQDIAVVRMRRKLDFAHILFKKQLFHQGAPILEELIEWCNRYHQPFFRGVLLQYESLFYQAMFDNWLDKLDTLRTEGKRVAGEIETATEAYEYYCLAEAIDRRQFVPRSDSYKVRARELLQHELRQLDESKMNLQSYCVFNSAVSGLYYLLEDYTTADFYEKKMRTAFNLVKEKTPIDWINYRNFLLSTMANTEKLQRYNEMEADLNELKSVMETYFPNDLITHSKYYIKMLDFILGARQFEKYADNIREIESHLTKTVDHMLEEDRIFLSWSLACLFFEIGNLKKAWKYCHDILMSKMEWHNELRDFMKIFIWLIYYESGELQLISTAIARVKSDIRKHPGLDYRFENTFIRFFSKLIKQPFGKKNTSALFFAFGKELEDELSAGHFHIRQAFIAYNFFNWINRHCNGSFTFTPQQYLPANHQI
ncbi:MAG: hypothetical protein U0T73_05030 [Chitinophagales bacterium]